MTPKEFVGACQVLGVLFYAYGFTFFLGMWLEDCEGRDFLKPLVLAIFWPIVMVPLAFVLGCALARKETP